MAFGYALGMHAPGKALMLDALPAAHHQLLGHGLADGGAAGGRARSRCAITNNYSPVWPASARRRGRPRAAAAFDTLQNRLFTDPVLLGRYPDLSAFGLGPAARTSSATATWR